MAAFDFQKELIALVLQDLPESIICAMLVFSFLRVGFEWKKLMGVAVLQAVTNLVRLFPIAFGIHSIVLIISLAVYIRLFTRVRLSRVFVAVMGTFVILMLMEFIYVAPLLKLTGKSYEEVFASPALRELYSLPYQLVMLAIALVKNHFNQRRSRFSA